MKKLTSKQIADLVKEARHAFKTKHLNGDYEVLPVFAKDKTFMDILETYTTYFEEFKIDTEETMMDLIEQCYVSGCVGKDDYLEMFDDVLADKTLEREDVNEILKPYFLGQNVTPKIIEMYMEHQMSYENLSDYIKEVYSGSLQTV